MNPSEVETPMAQHNVEHRADGVAEDSPLPQPDSDWLQQAGNVIDPQPTVHSANAGQHTYPPQNHAASRTRSKRTSFLSRPSALKAITATGVVGIAALGLLQLPNGPTGVADMLGTELIKLVPESAPLSRPNNGPIDPRLADPIALDMLQLDSTPQAPVPSAELDDHEPESIGQASITTPPVSVHADALPVDMAQLAQPVGVTPAPAPAPSPSQKPEIGPGDAPAGVTNEELMQRLQRLELLLAKLQVQAEIAAVMPQTMAKPPAPAPTAAAAPAPTRTTPATPHRAETAPRAAPMRMVKSPAPKPVKQAKSPAPTAAPSQSLSGQLVSVDMWNGEASVVIASGLPGDRRVRVLRPGDVVNGMALRSADPVTRSATFVAPGSQGLTLYVSQGG